MMRAAASPRARHAIREAAHAATGSARRTRARANAPGRSRAASSSGRESSVIVGVGVGVGVGAPFFSSPPPPSARGLARGFCFSDASALGTARLPRDFRETACRGSAGRSRGSPARRVGRAPTGAPSSFASRFFSFALASARTKSLPPSRAPYPRTRSPCPARRTFLPPGDTHHSRRRFRGTAGWRIVLVVRAVHEGPSRRPCRGTRARRGNASPPPSRSPRTRPRPEEPAASRSASSLRRSGWTPDTSLPTRGSSPPTASRSAGAACVAMMASASSASSSSGEARGRGALCHPPRHPGRSRAGRARLGRPEDLRQGRSRVRGRARLVGTPVARRDAPRGGLRVPPRPAPAPTASPADRETRRRHRIASPLTQRAPVVPRVRETGEARS